MNIVTPEIIDAIKALHPTAWVGVSSNNIDKIHWHDGNPTEITKEQIKAKLSELQTAYDAQEYARSRKAEYPPWDDQLDHIFHNGVASWKTNVVQPVKDKYPKG